MTADSAEGSAQPYATENPAINVLDGDNGTIWHTKYSGTASPLPHMITIAMGGAVNRVTGLQVRQPLASSACRQRVVHWCRVTAWVKQRARLALSTCAASPCLCSPSQHRHVHCAKQAIACCCLTHSRHEYVLIQRLRLQYVPRQDSNPPNINGNVGMYEIRVSTDGTTFPNTATVTGTLANTAAAKYIRIPGVNAKAVRLTVLTEAGGNGPWTSAAEINVRSITPMPQPAHLALVIVAACKYSRSVEGRIACD